MPFVKLDCQALDSTLWVLRPDREVFLTALLMAEPFEIVVATPALNYNDLNPSGFIVPPGWYGFVPASGPGIVRRAIVNDEEGRQALKRLSEPEAESRSHDFEGRRMVRIDGGYIILNFQKFRDRDHTLAERQRRWRERKRNAVTSRSNAVTTRYVTQAEAEAEASSQSSSAAPTNAEAIYELYPRKQGRKAALKAITTALKAKAVAELCDATRAFAEATGKWPATDHQFIPHPATWFNQGRYDDDRSTWIRHGSKTDTRPNSRRYEHTDDYSKVRDHGVDVPH